MNGNDKSGLRVAILTVSDACSRGERPDASGEVLARLVAETGWAVAERAMVPDEVPRIEATVSGWCGAVDCVLTTGGTGLSPRDVTPEATRRVIEKEIPGIPFVILQDGVGRNPHAALSRAVAGVARGTVVVNLPGSPKGAEESFRAIAALLPHAVHIARGGGH